MNEWNDRRVNLAWSWICPDCRSKLQECDARELHPAHKADEKGRKCTKCEYRCYFGGGQK